MSKRNRCYRMIPCPAYDVAGLEEWLTEMAETGWFLSKDGIIGGIACFERAENSPENEQLMPTQVRYRLMASEKRPGPFDENYGEADPEMKKIASEYSWEYVARRKDFYIFRTNDPGAVELNTDPEVQALTLAAVKKRKSGDFFSTFLLLVVYPLLLMRGGIVSIMLTLGSGWFLLIICVILAEVIGEIITINRFRKLQKQMETTGEIAPSSYKKHKKSYFIRSIGKPVVIILVVASFFVNWGREVTQADLIPLSEYEKPLPFVTMKDMAGDGVTNYELTITGGSFSTIREDDDFFAPKIIQYNEIASMMCADGTSFDGALYVDYYELSNEFLAKLIEKELVNRDAKHKTFKTFDVSAENVDSIVGYYNLVHFPGVVFRRGNVVMKVFFHQYTEEKMTVEEWLPLFTNR